jgi:hypothetical protein
MRENIEHVEDYIRKYPRIVSHIICESLGYAIPTIAGMILRDAHLRKENWCEWIYSCYNRDPLPALRGAIRNRKHHKGYMADYGLARAIVDRFNATDGREEPMLASWF